MPLNPMQRGVMQLLAARRTPESHVAGGVAINRAPEALKSQNRAVTPGDYEMLAMQAGPIARAKALPLYNPDFPGMQIPGVVTVIVVPNVAGPAPMPIPTRS